MFQKLAIATLFLTMGILSGCGGGLGVSNSQPGQNNGVSSGSLSASTASMDFGQVAIGGNKTLTVTLTNTSTSQDISVTQLTVSGTTFEISSSLTAPFTVAAGQSTDVGITYSPTTANSDTGSLTVVSNASDTNLVVGLTGTGTGLGQISAAPSPLDLGNVPVGGFASSSVIVSNATGNPSVTVTQFTVAGTGFSLVSPPAFPLILDGGGSVSLEVGFTAPGLGTSTGSLTIANDGSIPNLVVNLSATGVMLGANQLGMSPGVFSFGSIPVGSHQSLGGSLTAGSSDILVSSANWNGAGFSVTGITFPVTVPAGQSVPFNVVFAPTSPGAAAGGVSFVSNASNSPTAATFTGTGTQATQVALSWNDSDSVAGYNVYRGTTPGGPFPIKLNQSLLSTKNFADTTVQSGTTYYYVTTAVNSGGQESAYSSQASAVIP